jgi:hypothetical protein
MLLAQLDQLHRTFSVHLGNEGSYRTPSMSAMEPEGADKDLLSPTTSWSLSLAEDA